MPRVGRHAPLGLVGHVVPLVVDGSEVLLPKGLHALDGPRVLGVREVDRVKVHHRFFSLALEFCDKARKHQHLPLVHDVGVAQLRRPGALLAQLREGELGHVADHPGRGLARLAPGEDEPLAAGRVAQVGLERDARAEGGLGKDTGGRVGEHHVQVV